jgi:hypothetical protein
MRERDTERILRPCWVHSHEEDSDEEMVFRPAAYEFPPSRGRRSFELKPDGILAEGGIGPTASFSAGTLQRRPASCG